MSNKHNIAVIPGDGTGPEVVAEAVKALEAVSRKCHVDIQFKEFGLGGDRYLKEGTLLPDDVIGELRTADAILLGAIGHPGVKPGILEKEILLRLRFKLDLYINLRPVTLFPGVETPLKDKGPEDIDFVVVRENTEVTLCAKTNVLVYESDLWERTFHEVHKDYPDIDTNYMHVDALCMWMIKNPEQFDVVVTGNMFGDIITDIGAIIQGGLGIAAGGNINPEGAAMFEPIGGSAPKYSGQNIINPLATISAAQMMLDYLEEKEAATVLQDAIRKVLENDLKSLEAGNMGCGTKEVGDLVVGYIEG